MSSLPKTYCQTPFLPDRELKWHCKGCGKHRGRMRPYRGGGAARVARAQGPLPLLPGPPAMCQYPHHYCQQECLEGFSMCQFHILEDRSAPFRPCCFVYANGNKCGAPVPKKDSHHQCEEHRRRLVRARERADRAPPPVESLDSLAEQLRQNQAADSQPDSAAGGDWEVARRVLQQYDSESDSEAEGDRMVSSPLESPLSSDDGLSGASDDESESLRNAGVYTDEEVVRLAEQRLVRLQRLYLGQFQRLKHVLAHKRRAYLLDVAREKETMKSISGAPRDSPAEQEAYDQLRAHAHYQKPAGKDYLFWHHRNEKRSREAGKTARQSAFTRCMHAEGRVRCGVRTVPLSKYCLKHILQDSHQVLFRACGAGGGEPCQTAVPAVRELSRCPLHLPLPAPTAVRMPEESDPVEAMLGLSDTGEHLPLDETQSRLVATIANTLMASAAASGGATAGDKGGAGGAASDLAGELAEDALMQASETNSEVDVTGDANSEVDQSSLNVTPQPEVVAEASAKTEAAAAT